MSGKRTIIFHFGPVGGLLGNCAKFIGLQALRRATSPAVMVRQPAKTRPSGQGQIRTIVNNTKRTLAVASAMVVAGTLVSVAPATTTTADAATVKVKKKTYKQVKKTRKRVVRVARSKVGRQYRYGGTGPYAFDCSGLMWHSYRKATGKTLPRTAAGQNWGTKNVSRKNLKKGDLVFFYGNGHVAMYIGRGKIVHATNPRTGVRVDRLSGYWNRQVNGYGRVIFKK